MGAVLKYLVLLHVDVPRAAQFYAHGLGLAVNVCTSKWAELQSGPCKIALMEAPRSSSIHFLCFLKMQCWFSIYIASHTCKYLRPLKTKNRKTIPMLPPAWDMVLLHFRVDLSLYVILKQTLREWEGPWPLVSPSEGEHLEWAWTIQMAPISLKGKFLGFPHFGCKYLVHVHAPTMIGWTICGRMHWKC